MGEIWLARLSTGRGFEKTVVLKRLLPHLAEDADFLARFLDEARIAAALVHPNIVPVFELGEDEEGCFLVMEHIDGVDLRAMMASLRNAGEKIDPLLALHIARETALALDYAHTRLDERGHPLMIVHRDVSPSNILLGRDGAVRLTDFGIAAARVRLGRTATGHLRGKFAYMSPEQASGRGIDARSDVFALGIVLYEMLVGRRPFDGDAELQILERIRSGERDPIVVACPGLDPRIASLVEDALATAVADRIEGAGVFAERVDAILHDAGSPVGRRDVLRVVRECVGRQSADRESSGPSVGLDTLLRQQLVGGSDSVQGRHGGRTPSRSGRISRTPAQPSAPADATRTTADPAPPPRRRRRRGISPWVVAGLVGAVLLAVGWGAFALSRVRLTVESEPAGARVFVDGTPVGVTGLRTRLARGVRLIRVERDGYEPVEREVDLRSGPVGLELELLAAPALVTVDSVPPGAHVEIEGVAPFTAGTSVTLPTGRPLRVAMSAPGFVPWTGSVTIVPGQSSFSQRLEPVPTSLVAEAVAIDPVPPAPGQREPRDDERTPVDERSGQSDAVAPAAAGVETDAGGEPGALAAGTLVVRFVNEPRVGIVEIDGARVSVDGLATSYALDAGPHRVEVANDAHGKVFAATVDIEPDVEHVLAVEW
jgi:serine/threonine-protein kinase